MLSGSKNSIVRYFENKYYLCFLNGLIENTKENLFGKNRNGPKTKADGHGKIE